MSTQPFSVVILAAGKGTRMYSDLPKVLHPLAGKPMIQHVIDNIKALDADNIHLVYGHGASLLQQALADQPVNWVLQPELLGTGHAVQQVLSSLKENENVLILYGDCPLISCQTLAQLMAIKPKHGIALLTVTLDDPTGYGRIIRENGKVIGIVEQKDATPEQQKIQEVNTGIMFVSSKDLKNWLAQLSNNNAQKEFYLTDIIRLAHQDNCLINTINPINNYEVEGVNNRQQLAYLERYYQRLQAEKLLSDGVMITDPERFDLRGNLQYGRDVTIDINVILSGNVILGNNVKIGAGCLIKNCIIGDNCEISPYSVIEDAIIEKNCTVGPFARLRPGSHLAEQAHVGNFVEMKKATLGKGSKAGHLSYLGDADIGNNVNIGAGTITCNYDGANKFKTVIEDDVFIGSDSQLIAPVTVAKGATIAAGTTVTRNVEQHSLALSRVKQQQIANWARLAKKSS